MEQHSSAAAARHFEARREAAAAIWSSGNLLAHNRLPPLQDATTVRARDARVSATDGPYAETKELLGGCAAITLRAPS